MDKIIDREIAWRIFAHEFNRSDLYISEGDERAPNYIITPSGAKCNRLFIVGVVTEIENIGQDNNLWRARIADPTGVFTVYAGQYQPEAAIFLSELNVPAYVAVVGKARKYEPEDGSIYTSVRPEEINTADEQLRDRWVLDTAERTLERIRIIEESLKSELSGNALADLLLKKGTNPMLADGAVRAVEHYGNIDKFIAELKTAVIHAVQTVVPERDEKHAPAVNEPPMRPEKMPEEIEAIMDDETAPEMEKQHDLTWTEPKEALADIIDRLDTGKGTSYSLVVETALSAGIDAESVAIGIKELMAEGRCYEPKIGVLRKV